MCVDNIIYWSIKNKQNFCIFTIYFCTYPSQPISRRHSDNFGNQGNRYLVNRHGPGSTSFCIPTNIGGRGKVCVCGFSLFFTFLSGVTFGSTCACVDGLIYITNKKVFMMNFYENILNIYITRSSNPVECFQCSPRSCSSRYLDWIFLDWIFPCEIFIPFKIFCLQYTVELL